LLGSYFSFMPRRARRKRRALFAADHAPLAPQLGRAGPTLAPRPARRVRLGLGPRRILPRPRPRSPRAARAALRARLQRPAPPPRPPPRAPPPASIAPLYDGQ